jgi:tripartite-type tricarboxylate transporter receptor subunit TctC
MRLFASGLFAALATLGLGWHSAGHAQDAPPPGYPARPIRIIVPVVPGGGLDMLSRSIGQMLSEKWGQSVIVDNRPGGGTVLATEIAAQAAPDGYTFLSGTDTLRIVGIMKRVKFDVRKALQPVVPIAGQPYVLIVNASLPVKNVKDLIAYSMNTPVSYGSSGVGTVGHIGLEILTAKTGAKLIHVPYKGGGQALMAVLGGEIHMYPGLLLSASAALKSGKARAIAVASLTRLPAMPELPTVAEHGFPGFKITNSYGLFAPAGTPRPVLNAVNRAVGEFMHSPAITQRLLAEGSEPAERMSPDQYRAAFNRDYEDFERQLKQINIKLY